MLADVIAAPATPVGQSAVSVIRVSGDEAFAVCGRVLDPFEESPVRTVRRSRARHPDHRDVLDDVLYSVFAAPASYTGQHLVEISTHGGLLVPVEVLGALYRAGARPAAPGEFTRRAVLNHKMDLLQAEAVGDLISATAPAQRRAAISQLDRGLSLRVEQLREHVLALESLVCYEIDFPEEDSGPVSDGRVREAIHTVIVDFETMLRSSGHGERLRDGALAVVAGRPNAGKSSLFNALVGAERVIVTDTPGTTRDAVEAPVSCHGMPFRLVDTAGLRTTGDQIERMGIEVSHRYLEGADLVLFCAPADSDLEADDRRFLGELSDRAILIRTKCDLAGSRAGRDGLDVSALTGEGLDALREAMVRHAFGAYRGAAVEPQLTRERHRAALTRGLEEVRAFADARSAGIEAAVAAVHLRGAVTALEDVIGVVTHDDVLDIVFRSFCIGK